MTNIWMFLQQTAAVSLTALFLLALQKIFQDKLSPKWQYAIWSVLLLRLVLPAGRRSGLVLDLTPWLDSLRALGELELNSAWATPWAAALPVAGLPFLPGGAPRSVTDWLFAVYLLGAALCGVWLLLGWWRLWSMARRAVPVEGARREEIRLLADKLGLKPPKRVVETTFAHCPFLMGVFCPTLVVPMGWTVDEKVILHELLHRNNRDVLFGWLTALFRCVHWCNPFLWWVFDRIDHQREERCDQQVLERLAGEERRDYGRVLLSMADDWAVRVPGATSMANGGQKVKKRIQAIARFKSFPTGTGLVTVCMALVLAQSLVLGYPAAAFTPDRVNGVGEGAYLSYGQRNPCTTVASALDAYAKCLYYRYNSPYEMLLCGMSIALPEDMPKVRERTDELWEERQERMKALELRYLVEYRTGPQFRGLSQLDENRWVCQVYMFRDVYEVIEPWNEEPALDWLCHTVEITRQPDGRHTVRLLKEEEGFCYYWDLGADLSSGNMAKPPVTWTGEAEGVRVEIIPRWVLTVQNGWVNARTSDMWNTIQRGGERTDNPDPDANFSSSYDRVYVRLVSERRSDTEVKVQIDMEWQWMGDEVSRLIDTVNGHRGEGVRGVLDAHGDEVWATSGGGVQHANGVELERALGPDHMTATLRIDGVDYPLELTREENWHG